MLPLSVNISIAAMVLEEIKLLAPAVKPQDMPTNASVLVLAGNEYDAGKPTISAEAPMILVLPVPFSLAYPITLFEMLYPLPVLMSIP